MIEKKISSLILFGTGFRYLQRKLEGNSVHGSGNVISVLRRFFSNLDEIGLTVTRRAAGRLFDEMEKLKKLPKGTKLEASQARRIEGLVKELRPTLLAEAGGMMAYIISERRFQVEALIDDPSKLFGNGSFKKLPSISQQDFSESMKCLAFERPTAAAFHMLRAVEATLMEYYCSKVKRNRSQLMWGPVIQAMRSKPKLFPKILLNQLDHIREGFRNPTAHPDKIFTIDEAQDLLAICVDAANRIAQEL